MGQPLTAVSGDPRRILAEWMTSPKNPWFARLAVNRLWKQFLGRGLVESEDDLRSTNPPTNEPLLDYLTGRLVAGEVQSQSGHAGDPKFARLSTLRGDERQ